MKKYRFSFIVLVFLAIILFFSTNCKNVQRGADSDSMSSYSSGTPANNSIRDNVRRPTHDIDIPSPLKHTPEQILYRKGYVVSYNKDTRLPNWVAWHLTAAHVDGNARRPGNAWHEDMDVPMPRANNGDYKGSGWTHGHMCPAGDNKWDSEAMYESFLYTNCCPQNGNLNAGTWNQIELSCRRWAKKHGGVYIVSGPVLFRQEHQTIGQNKVIVPEAFFKVIVCLNDNSPKGIGFICRNTDGNRKKDLYVNTIKQVERITGMTFFPHLPKRMEKAVKEKADISEWD
ncbi:MAG: DNA/RNA non-specific endonuclease [Prevotella sp.]|nr:DNA/RNA non-specific endonuclease [Prevotella sp.]